MRKIFRKIGQKKSIAGKTKGGKKANRLDNCPPLSNLLFTRVFVILYIIVNIDWYYRRHKTHF